jgi:hypothetical protein
MYTPYRGPLSAMAVNSLVIGVDRGRQGETPEEHIVALDFLAIPTIRILSNTVSKVSRDNTPTNLGRLATELKITVASTAPRRTTASTAPVTQKRHLPLDPVSEGMRPGSWGTGKNCRGTVRCALSTNGDAAKRRNRARDIIDWIITLGRRRARRLHDTYAWGYGPTLTDDCSNGARQQRNLTHLTTIAPRT